MRATSTNDAGLVDAARAGDRRALDSLVAASLPLVYAIVRRALSGHPDADDVVQDTMLRVVRQLPGLQNPERYRAWLAAIAVHQVSTHLRRRDIAGRRSAPLEEAVAIPDADAEFEDLSILRLDLSGQRRQVERASRWLDPDDRTLLSLWWLEAADELTRTELAEALEVSVAHAGVRVQRMRQQLETSRKVVAALDASPRCAVLDELVSDWDGRPSPLWRKRIARHTRSCGVCRRAAEGLIAPERLLAGFALLPLPAGLAAGVAGQPAPVGTVAVSGGLGAGAKAGLVGKLVQAIVAHPIAAAIAGALTASAVATVTILPAEDPPSSGLAATPSAAPATRPASSQAPVPGVPPPRPPSAPSAAPSPTRTQPLAPGRPASVESAEEPGRFVTVADSLGILTPIRSGSPEATRRQATFAVVAGLADASCFSFRAQDGRYLRHASWRLRLNQDEGTPLFRGDATFCVRPGATRDSIMLEASNYPGWFLRHRGTELWVDQSDGSAAFRAAGSFRTRSPLAPW